MNRPLVDSCARPVTYLRISVTDHCNFSCMYCTPEKPAVKLRHEDILTFEEILRLARVATGIGIRKIRITGGEPLMRRGIGPFLRKLGALPGLETLAITTNGSLLDRHLDDLLAAGVSRINVSLDTLRPNGLPASRGGTTLKRSGTASGLYSIRENSR